MPWPPYELSTRPYLLMEEMDFNSIQYSHREKYVNFFDNLIPKLTNQPDRCMADTDIIQPGKEPVYPSLQQHTLPNRDYVLSISEVVILNNDQHQHQKIMSTNNRINWKIKQQHRGERGTLDRFFNFWP